MISPSDLCSRLTRRSRSNFYYAFLALPRPRREALYAVYAFCRTVDDIADDTGADGVEPRRRALADWRDDVHRCYEPGEPPRHPIARRLAAAVARYAIPRDALLAIVDGVEMDLDRSTYETADDLYPYCYRVASAVGLCCIEIFGYTQPSARRSRLPTAARWCPRRSWARSITRCSTRSRRGSSASSASA